MVMLGVMYMKWWNWCESQLLPWGWLPAFTLLSVPTRYGQNNKKPNSSVCVLTLVLISQLSELERSLSNSLLNLEASNAELEKFKLERAQLQAQLESVSVWFFSATIQFRTYSTLFSFLFPEQWQQPLVTVKNQLSVNSLFRFFQSITFKLVGFRSIFSFVTPKNEPFLVVACFSF